jgi:hypothetical protein
MLCSRFPGEDSDGVRRTQPIRAESGEARWRRIDRAPRKAPTSGASHPDTPYAVVRLRSEGGDGVAATAEVEITVASRW